MISYTRSTWSEQAVISFPWPASVSKNSITVTSKASSCGLLCLVFTKRCTAGSSSSMRRCNNFPVPWRQIPSCRYRDYPHVAEVVVFGFISNKVQTYAPSTRSHTSAYVVIQSLYPGTSVKTECIRYLPSDVMASSLMLIDSIPQAFWNLHSRFQKEIIHIPPYLFHSSA